MKFNALPAAALAGALLLGVASLASAESLTGSVILKSPDGRVYTAPVSASMGGGVKLDKQSTKETHAGPQPISTDRVRNITKGIIPGNADADCKAFLTFHLKREGENYVAELRGTHGTCKSKVDKQGTVVSCPNAPSLKVVQWAGEKEPSEDVCKVPTLATENKKKS
jgi:hypothetical protein